MIDIYLETFGEYAVLVILLLIIVKTIGFFTMGSKRLTYKNYLYFSDNNLRNTKDPVKKRRKNVQNYLSITIIALILLVLLVFMLGAFFKTPPPQ